MKILSTIDRVIFFVSVTAGATAAIAGGFGWTYTAVIAGCIAAAAPIVNRITATKQHEKLLADIGPRTLSAGQRKQLVQSLKQGPAFEVWIAHNRHEGEPANYHSQIFGAFEEAGFSPKWFGGMTNTTIGIEISGDSTPEKTRLMNAFAAADIPFLPITLTGREADHWKLAVWIGSNPGPHRR
ncbi:hypothetical protein [Alcaligenes sp. WGS1538]|uniref:hypothetical protein n=1 Tax=Alcaligenes sp. WGS1538 TaxID=3366811 RepID=UPI00372D2F39